MLYDTETLQHVQRINLQTLIDIDKVCKKHEITYFLDSGTALGARRHSGFIPWDDDVDLGMLRSDYEKFLEVAPLELSDKYVVCNPRSNNKIASTFAKVWLRGTKFATRETIDAHLDQGIFIDIIPYDVLSSDEKISAGQRKKCRLAQYCLYLFHSPNVNLPHKGLIGGFERVACYIAHYLLRLITSHEAILGYFEDAASMGKLNPSDIYLQMCWTGVDGFTKSCLLPSLPLQFEGYEFPCPSNIEEYLSVMYGDWETLPSVEERHQHSPEVLNFGKF